MNENNKRIAYNTIYLYIRQFIVIIIGFITTRIVLDKLGASDFGINNLVYGFVAMFAILNNILSTSSRRFIALYLGKGNATELKQVFSTSLILHIAIGFFIALVLETLGLWLLNSDLNIPINRMGAANWLFQFAVITTLIGVAQTPFEATITAHEKFNVYAWMSIYTVVSKLIAVILLVIIPGDKLIIYGALNLFISITGFIIYSSYCRNKFQESNLSIRINKLVLKEMLTFSGWGTLGHIIQILNTQGISVILNLFFNTVINAARGLAGTVNAAISTFISGFNIASQPQLVKYYGSGDMVQFRRLIFNSSQYTLFIIAIVMTPVLLEIDFVVKLWLGNEVPPYTTAFIRITMICTIVYSSNAMIDYGLNAIGRVKELNCYSVPLYLLTVPLSYIALKLNFKPTSVYWIAAIPAFLSFVINLILLSKYTGFKSWRFFNIVFIKTIILIALSLLPPYLLQIHMNEGLLRFFVITCFSIFCTGTVLFFLGMNKTAQQIVISKIAKLINR